MQVGRGGLVAHCGLGEEAVRDVLGQVGVEVRARPEESCIVGLHGGKIVWRNHPCLIISNTTSYSPIDRGVPLSCLTASNPSSHPSKPTLRAMHTPAPKSASTSWVSWRAKRTSQTWVRVSSAKILAKRVMVHPVTTARMSASTLRRWEWSGGSSWPRVASTFSAALAMASWLKVKKPLSGVAVARCTKAVNALTYTILTCVHRQTPAEAGTRSATAPEYTRRPVSAA